MPSGIPIQLRIAVALALAAFAIHFRVAWTGATWDDANYHLVVTPPRLAAAEQVQAGALPMWWEGSGLGVPLAAEPTHGALYPPGWLARTPIAYDWLAIVHVWWLALGVACLALRRHRATIASAIGVVVIASPLLIGAHLAGELVAVAHLPWIAVAVRSRHRAAPLAVASLLGVVGLTGSLGGLIDALIVAAVFAPRLSSIAVPGLCGLAIALLQWIPATMLLTSDVVGGELGGVSWRAAADRLLGAGWVGALVIAVAVVGCSGRGRVTVGGLGLLGLAAIANAAPSPHWVGEPTVHLAAFSVMMMSHWASRPVLLARSGISIVAGAAVVVLGMIVGAGSTGAAGAAIASAVAMIAAPSRDGEPWWREWLVIVALAVPGVVAIATAPMIDRGVVDQPPPGIAAAIASPQIAPPRVYRPAQLATQPFDDRNVTFARPRPPPPRRAPSLAERIALCEGMASARWQLAPARSEDPARSRWLDAAWQRSAARGGELLDRFSIEFAWLPATVIAPGRFRAIDTRGDWALVALPVAPSAAVLTRSLAVDDRAAALARLFPVDGSRGVPRDTAVVVGASADDSGPPGVPLACRIADWRPGDIQLGCASDRAGYAVVSSSAARGWEATLDGDAVAWVVVDGVRRGVAMPAGHHAIGWRYRAPGWPLASALALLGWLAAVGWCVARKT